jgi:hypothetical protein
MASSRKRICRFWTCAWEMLTPWAAGRSRLVRTRGKVGWSRIPGW